MKKLTTILAVLMVGVFLFAGSASATAVKFDFKGNYEVSESATSGTYEIDFSSGTDMYGGTIPYSGVISRTFTPKDDGLFSDMTGEFVELSTLSFIQDSNGNYDFNPTNYVEGFKVWDYNLTSNSFNLLFQADLSVSTIVSLGTTGSTNPDFALNLTNISKGSTYVAGSSDIVDAFLNSSVGGATQITFQWGGEGQFIPTSSGTYSATAAPVPEPATMLLLGSGLLGMGTITRRKKSKK